MNPTEAYRAAGADPFGSGSGPDDSRVLRAVEEYLAALEAGRAPAREEFLARHADIAGRLGDYLDGLELIHRAGSAAGAAADPGAPADDLAGADPLGDFLLVREVGRGGMGVVYEAVQRSLNRRVALKVLPFAAMMDSRQPQRFHNEARAAACLHHPHIVPVYAVGQDRAVHYYAMQFIDGRTLAEFISQQRGEDLRHVPTIAQVVTTPAEDSAEEATSAAPRGAAYFRRVAEWGIQAAEALDHAHQMGVVHRDVKPANLLVDAAGRLWVTDFGLAQIQNDARLTQTGDLVGTLRYMSPEQALAKRVVLDHRTDVYSLGATLYELFTLQPAYGGSDRQELLRQIAFEESMPPRRLSKAVPAELETIVLKAMEKNPEDRYATAKDLADDLRRFLEDRPIRARRPSPLQRLHKWGRRHRAAVWAAAACLLVVLVTLGGTAGWVMSARAYRQREAERKVTEALKASKRGMRDGNPSDPDLMWALRQVEAQLDGGAVGPELEGRVRQLLKDAAMLAHLEKFRLGETVLIDQLFRDYGIDVEALEAEEAAALVRDSAIREHLVTGLDEWARKIMWQNDEKGRQQMRRVVAVARQVDQDPWRDRLRDLMLSRDVGGVEQLARSAPVEELSAATLGLLARLVVQSGERMLDPREGWPADHLPESVQLLRRAQRCFPADYWINICLAEALGQRPSLECRREAVGFCRVAVALRPQNPAHSIGLGGYLRAAGEPAEAEAIYRKLSEYSLLGDVLLEQGKAAEAEAAYRKALEADSTQMGAAWDKIHDAWVQQGKPPEAVRKEEEAFIRRQFKAWEDATTKPSRSTHFGLGLWLYHRGKLAEAEAAFRKAIDLDDYPLDHCYLGAVLRDEGRFAEALASLRRGHALYSSNQEPSEQWVKLCERLVELDAKLPSLLRGEEQPTSATEQADYAELCGIRRYYAAAVRFYRAAITAQPDLVASPVIGIRYKAAHTAALASRRAGEDTGRLTEAELAGLRKQALDWLRADLDSWRDLLNKDPDKPRPAVTVPLRYRLNSWADSEWSRSSVALHLSERMRDWQDDTAFNGLRGPDALAKLPEAEREGWQRFWADVAATLASSQQKWPPAEESVAPKERPKHD
jgi:serine/threonine protein kinase/tetratricopeptide (TPR) repeat protein